MCPVFDRLFRYLPEIIRRPLSFGVVYDKSRYDVKEQKVVASAYVYENGIVFDDRKEPYNGRIMMLRPNIICTHFGVFKPRFTF